MCPPLGNNAAESLSLDGTPRRAEPKTARRWTEKEAGKEKVSQRSRREKKDGREGERGKGRRGVKRRGRERDGRDAEEKSVPDMKYSPTRGKARAAARVTLYYYPLSHLPALLCAAKNLGTINKRLSIVSHCCAPRADTRVARRVARVVKSYYSRDRKSGVLIGHDVDPN